MAAVGLILALASVLVHWPGFGYDEVRRPFVMLAASLVFIAGAVTPPKRPSGREGGPASLALLAIAASALFALNRTDAAAALMPAVAAWILLRAIALEWIPRDFLERRGLLLVSGIGALFSGCGLCQYLGADFLGFGRDRLAVSTVGNTNYAGILSAVFAITGGASAVFQRGGRRAPGAAAALLGALHVAASGSLGGLLGLAAGAVAFALLLVRRHGWKPAALIPLVILVAAVAPFATRVAHRVSDIVTGEDRTGRVRIGLWKGTLRLAAAHPILGCGAGNFRMAFPPHRDADERRISHEGAGVGYVEAEDPHNTYLAVLAESGPVALIALVAALVLALRAGIRRAADPDPEAAGLAIAGVAGLVALAISAIFNSLSAHLPFAVLAAFLAGAASPVSTQPAPARSLGMKIAWIATAVLLALGPLPWFVADAHYRDAMHTASPEERLVHAQRAVSTLPGHWQARFQIAMSWRALGEGEGTVRAELREVLKVHPHSVAALIELSTTAPPGEQEELLRRVETLAPEFVLVQSRLAGVDLRKRDYASARRRMERILASLPDEPEAAYTIGVTLVKERRFEEAVPWFKRAIAKNPKLRERLADDHPELKFDSRFAGLLGP